MWDELWLAIPQGAPAEGLDEIIDHDDSEAEDDDRRIDVGDATQTLEPDAVVEADGVQ